MEKAFYRFNLNNALVKVFREDHTPDFDYGNEEENTKELKRFESGELEHVVIEVSVSDKSGHVIGRDVLGGIFVLSANFEESIIETIHDNSMIETAKEDLERILNEVKSANQ